MSQLETASDAIGPPRAAARAASDPVNATSDVSASIAGAFAGAIAVPAAAPVANARTLMPRAPSALGKYALAPQATMEIQHAKCAPSFQPAGIGANAGIAAAATNTARPRHATVLDAFA